MPESLGRLVELRRNVLELSMRELARRVGVDVGYISRIEKGHVTNPSFSVTMRLAKELGIKVESLIEVFGLDEDLNTIIDASMDNSIHGRERDMISGIVSDIVELSDSPDIQASRFGVLFEKIFNLRSMRHKENYYVVTIVDKDWLRVLKTPVVDETFLSLYHQIYDSQHNDSFLVKGELELMVSFARTEMVTLRDVWDKCNGVSEEEDEFDVHRHLKEHLKRIDVNLD